MVEWYPVCHFHLKNLFWILVLAVIVNASSTRTNETSTTSQSKIPDCSLRAQKVGAGLGSLVLIETLFCCFVLYRWIKNYRISKKKKKQQVDDGETNRSYPRQLIDTDTKNYQKLSGPKPVSSYQSLTNKRLPKTGESGNVFEKLRRFLFNHETKSHGQSNSQANAVENEVYYEPTRNVEAKDITHAQMETDAYYHVLEDPENQLPQETQGQKLDSLYYCSEDCVDTTTKRNQRQMQDAAYYHVLEDPENQLPQEAQGKVAQSLYYCSEDCVDSIKDILHKGIKPLPDVPKRKVLVNTPQKPLRYYHVLEKESETKEKTTTNKAANQIKPKICKPGLNDNVIKEMKNRAVQNKTKKSDDGKDVN